MSHPAENGSEKRFGMDIDLDKCVGCSSCMVACMAENNVPFRPDDTDKWLSTAWMRVYRLTNGKPYPKTEICYLPRPCMHCDGHHGHSPCVSVCPAEALALRAGRALILKPEDCWYCGECEEMCPVGAISRSFEITFADGA